MPRMGQIIPKYQVPHVQTYINDNSYITTEAPTVANQNSIRMLQVFASPKGEDGVIKTFEDVNEFLEEYGTPNYNLYGQAQYNAYAALLTRNAKVHCLRVTSTSTTNPATYSNQIFCLAVKETVADAGGDGVAPISAAFSTKVITKSQEGLIDRESLPTVMDELVGTTTDDGYTIYPFMAVVAKGKGAYADSLRLRIAMDSFYNNDNVYMNYIFELLDNYSGTIYKKNQFNGTLNVDAIVNMESLCIQDVMIDADSDFDVYVNYESIKSVYDAYSTFSKANFADVVIPAIDDCELITGVDRTGAALPNYTKVTDDSDAVALDVEVGVALANGSDGDFAADFETQTDAEGNIIASRELALEEAYVAAFKGEFDPSIKSRRSYPAELFLDANYPEAAKLQMVKLLLGTKEDAGVYTGRYDARCFIDAGININTVEQAKAWLNKTEIKSIDDAIVSKEIQHYKIKDPFTGRPITVTTTYFIASEYPNHFVNVGNHIPFVSTNAVLSNYVKRSLKPDIDADVLDVKDALYTLKANFFECIGENVYTRATQTTSQVKVTDLCEESNVMVLLEMKRRLENYVSTRLFDFADAEQRRIFSEDATDMFRDYRNNKVRSYEVYFDMNEFEEERNILHCYLSVVFRTVGKRGIIEIDINSRV